MRKSILILSVVCGLLFSSVTFAKVASIWGFTITQFGGSVSIDQASGLDMKLRKTVHKVNNVELGGNGYVPCQGGFYRPVEGGECVITLENYYSPRGDDAQYACEAPNVAPPGSSECQAEGLCGAGEYRPTPDSYCTTSQANYYSPANEDNQYACNGADEAPAGSDSIDDCVDPFGGITAVEYVGVYWAVNNQMKVKWKITNTAGKPEWIASTGVYQYPSGEFDYQYPAFRYCEDLGGDAKWRLPTKNELMLHYNAGPLAGIDKVRPDCWYWSSEGNTPDPIRAWHLDMESGTTYYEGKGNEYKVVCVHD